MEDYEKQQEEYKKTFIKGHIYVIKSLDLYKIGRTSNIFNRLKKFTTENPHGIEIIIIKDYEHTVAVEQKLHEFCKDYHYQGEWFKLTPKKLYQLLNYMILSEF